jgi:hypothetical protein
VKRQGEEEKKVDWNGEMRLVGVENRIELKRKRSDVEMRMNE